MSIFSQHLLTYCPHSVFVCQALVYYTFGALGGNLISHMILVSWFVCQLSNDTVTVFLKYKKMTFPLIVLLGIPILGRCGCSPELWVSTNTLSACGKSGWAFTAFFDMIFRCDVLVLHGQITWLKLFSPLLLSATTFSGQWRVPDRGLSGAEDQAAGWGGEPRIYQWDVGGGLDPVLSVSGWERRCSSSGKLGHHQYVSFVHLFLSLQPYSALIVNISHAVHVS